MFKLWVLIDEYHPFLHTRDIQQLAEPLKIISLRTEYY